MKKNVLFLWIAILGFLFWNPTDSFSGSSYYYAKVTVDIQSGRGTVYASTSGSAGATTTNETASASIKDRNLQSGESKNNVVDLYCFAEPAPGYRFDHWTYTEPQNGSYKSGRNTYYYYESVTSDTHPQNTAIQRLLYKAGVAFDSGENSARPHEVHAHFCYQAKITGKCADIEFNVDDAAVVQKEVTFNVTDADESPEAFNTPVITGDNIALVSTTYRDGKIVVTVAYTPRKKTGIYKGTVTLSEIEKHCDNTPASSQTVSLTIHEDFPSKVLSYTVTPNASQETNGLAGGTLTYIVTFTTSWGVAVNFEPSFQADATTEDEEELTALKQLAEVMGEEPMTLQDYVNSKWEITSAIFDETSSLYTFEVTYKAGNGTNIVANDVAHLTLTAQGNDTETGIKTATLTAVKIPYFEMSNAYDFGNVPLDETASITLIPSNLNAFAKSDGVAWTCSIVDAADNVVSGAFSVTSNGAGGYIVTLSPTAQGAQTAYLKITASKNGHNYSTKTLLTAFILPSSFLYVNGKTDESHTFRTVTNTPVSTSFIINTHNIAGDVRVSNSAPAYFSYRWIEQNSLLEVSVNAIASTGHYDGVISLEGTNSLNNSDILHATINVSVDIVEIDMHVYSGHNQIVLTFVPRADATQYDVTLNGTAMTKVSDPTPEANYYTYKTTGLNTLQEYICTVIAQKKNGSDVDNIASTTVTKWTSKITKTDADYFDITFPRFAYYANRSATGISYKQYVLNSISHLYDETGHTYMDSLYFLVDDATAANAKAYVYVPNTAKTEYDLKYSFNPKDQFRKITGSGKKLYCAGSMINANTGTGTNTEGFFYFYSENGNETIDFYLEDCFISAKSKGNEENRVSMQEYNMGGASAFAVTNNAEGANKKVSMNFHIKGESALLGNKGVPLVYKTMGISVKNTELHSSAVSICPKADKREAQVSFDDIWADGKTRTNGYLRFWSNSFNTTSIDLGNKYGTCVFNGGQYNVFNYYVVSETLKYIMCSSIGIRFTARQYGYHWGGSELGGKVIFKDGTFMLTPHSTVANAKPANFRTIYDFRVPQDSRVDGGTFINDANPYCMDKVGDSSTGSSSLGRGEMPKNSKGDQLCRYEVFLPSEFTEKVRPNGTVDVTMTDIDSRYADYNYGLESVVAKDNKLYIYLPTQYKGQDCSQGELYSVTCADNTEYKYWEVVMPEVVAKSDIGAYKVSDIPGLKEYAYCGDHAAEYDNNDANHGDKNAFFAYFELDDYVVDNASVTIPLANSKITADIAYKDTNKKIAELTNKNDVTFQFALYYVIPLVSNKWYNFIPPFDVARMYIAEHTTLENKRGGTEYPYDDEGTAKFLAEQGKLNFKMAWDKLILPMEQGAASDNLINLLRTAHYNIPELVYYNPNLSGHGAQNAHFYLYEATTDGAWELRETAENGESSYSGNWKYVTPVRRPKGTYKHFDVVKGAYDEEATDVIMLAPEWDENEGAQSTNHVYSMYFPSGLKERYWDGKYLIMEGLGPQTLYGKDLHDDFPKNSNIPTGNVKITGNFTFGRYETSEKVFVANDKNVFVPQTRPTIYPGRVYGLCNADNIDKIKQINQDGTVVWGVPEQNENTTNLPTLQEGYFTVLPHNGSVILYANTDVNVNIFTSTGQLVWAGEVANGTEQHVSLENGLYIVSANGESKKVIVQ